MNDLAEPTGKCPGCGVEMPLSSGWGPVGDKHFVCANCGAPSELVVSAAGSGS
jgi:hypothetical protein